MHSGPSQILPFLYLGGYLDARDADSMQRLEIRRILNVSESFRASDAGGFEYAHVPISDYGNTDLSTLLDQCYQFIDAAKASNQNILVHCRHGQNRSPTVVLAYLMAREGQTLRDAYTLVAERRPQIGVHEDYFAALQTIEKNLHGKVSLQSAEVGPSIQDIVRLWQQEKGK